MSGVFDREEERLAGLRKAAAGDDDADVGVDPVKGRERRPAGPAPLKTGSVQWEADLTNKLRVIVAEEDVTRRAVLNVLLRQWLGLSKTERRVVLEEARQWEKDRA